MNTDWRDIEDTENSWRIPAINYCDQPYMTRTADGAWLCCLTTGPGHEGEPGEHVATFRSTDRGRTWTDHALVEPDCPLENAYAVLLTAPSGRIFVFYDHNTDNIREWRNKAGVIGSRVDELGYFVFKYSDDHGRTWSKDRISIPFREFACDRNNAHRGEIRFFWNVGQPLIYNGSVYVTLNRFEEFPFEDEGSLLRSPDLLTVADPADATWETLPDGDVGIKAPEGDGTMSEEHKLTVLSDGTFYDTFRNLGGHSGEAISRDGGHSWTVRRMQRASGRTMKHPVAANFVWKCGNGKYLYWFHNHGGSRFINRKNCWDSRNPVWMAPGVEVDTPAGKTIKWGEPEILFYHTDITKRMSYPDMMEEQDYLYFTETEKKLARIHRAPRPFFEKMWQVVEGKEISIDEAGCSSAKGFSLLLTMTENCGGELFRAENMVLRLTDDKRFVFECNGKSCQSEQISFCKKLVLIADASAGIVSFVADGVFLDGGEEMQFGWSRMEELPVQAPVTTGGTVVYDRPLMTAEAVFLTRMFSSIS